MVDVTDRAGERVTHLVEESLARGIASGDVVDGCLSGREWLARWSPTEAPVLVLEGMPGVGKTIHLLELARRLTSGGVAHESLLYLDCADARLAGAGPALPVLVADAFFRLRPHLRRRRCVFLLDNADAASGWGRALPRLLDTYDVRFVLTCGSWPTPGGAGFDLAPGLAFASGSGPATGPGPAFAPDLASAPAPSPGPAAGAPSRPRADVVRLEPLTFAQYVAHRREGARGADYAVQPDDCIDGYLAGGGLPQAVLAADERRATAVLQARAEQAALRAASRLGCPAGADALRAVTQRALGGASEALSVTRVAEELAACGITCSRPAIAAALDALERAGLIRRIAPLGCADPGGSRVARTVFACDVGLAAAHMVPDDASALRLMRNAVYLRLLREAPDAQVCPLRLAPGRFADFAVAEARGGEEPRRPRAVRVVHVVDETRDAGALRRGARTLERAMLVSGLPVATLVSVGTEATLTTDAGEVRIVPLWRFLL